MINYKDFSEPETPESINIIKICEFRLLWLSQCNHCN